MSVRDIKARVDRPTSRLGLAARQRREPPPDEPAVTEPLTDEDREFLSPARSLIETPPSPVRVAIGAAICALVVIAVLVGVLGKVDIYAEAQGRTQPIGRSKVIQPLDAGKIRGVFVRDGDRVRAGQLLVELDPTEPAANAQAAGQETAALTAEAARRAQAIAAARQGRFAAPGAPAFGPAVGADLQARETSVLQADLAELGATVSSLRARLAENLAEARSAELTLQAHRSVMATLQERVDIRSKLQVEGWESRTNVIDAREDLGKEQTSYANAQGQLAQARASAATQRQQIQESVSKFIDDNAQQMREAQNKLDQKNQDMVKAALALRHTRLTAPIDGTVQQLAVTTLGQVVTSGQQLMTIVPGDAPLEIEAEMPNKDIGFVRVGQPAVVKVDAFPFTRYGVLHGHVVRVSRDAVDSQEAASNRDTRLGVVQAQASAASPTAKVQDLVYPVTVRLDRNVIRISGRDVPLTPGMNVTVEVKTGQRRVISYVLSPFVEVTSEAGHER